MAYPAAAINLMVEESVTNGVWYHLLSQAFPFPTYIIAPEYRSSKSNRVDLFVIRVRENKAVFALEGKKEGTVANFQSDAQQIIGYLGDIRKNGTKGYAFGVLAAGPLYAILQNDGSRTQRRLEPIHGPPFALTTGRFSGLDSPGDLRGPADYATAQQILASIELWIRNNVQ